eukprot:scaffold209439_cov19-Tisochrysis_lutea.AAC.3
MNDYKPSARPDERLYSDMKIWQCDLGGYETVSPKFERCATFKVASLDHYRTNSTDHRWLDKIDVVTFSILHMTCEEWHADNRHICTKFGNEVDPQVGNLTGKSLGYSH